MKSVVQRVQLTKQKTFRFSFEKVETFYKRKNKRLFMSRETMFGTKILNFAPSTEKTIARDHSLYSSL